MFDIAANQIRDRFDAAVRVPGKPFDIVLGILSSPGYN